MTLFYFIYFIFFNGIHKDFLIIDFNLEERTVKREHLVKFHIQKDIDGYLIPRIGLRHLNVFFNE